MSYDCDTNSEWWAKQAQGGVSSFLYTRHWREMKKGVVIFHETNTVSVFIAFNFLP